MACSNAASSSAVISASWAAGSGVVAASGTSFCVAIDQSAIEPGSAVSVEESFGVTTSTDLAVSAGLSKEKSISKSNSLAGEADSIVAVLLGAADAAMTGA